MRKIIILSILAIICRLLLTIYYVPIFEKSKISNNLDNLKTYKFLNKINNNRPFQRNIDVIYFSEKDLSNKIVQEAYSERSLRMNDDEEQNFAIAVNLIKGDNYSIYDSKKNLYKITSTQHTFPVFVYKFFIENKINFDYFILIFIVINTLLFYFSIIYFYKLSLIFLNKSLSEITTLIYCLYPSVLFYVGPLIFYENIALSLLIISSYFFIKNNNYYNFILIIPMAILSLLFRFQTIFIWIFFFAFFTLFEFYKFRKIKNFIPICLFVFFTFLALKPIFDKNNNLFGDYVYTTHTGYMFFNGANKLARGSWDGIGKSRIEIEKKVNNDLNELERGRFYLTEGLNWIKENPFDYLILEVRKLVIYFLPQNLSVLPYNRTYNPINLLIHIGFVFYFLSLILKKNINQKNVIILSPIIGSLIISLIFFVGYRWRYYAEPFMILTAITFISQFYKKNKD